ncbi:hypothetical protein ROHU_012071 [Labeo rohita]|uniref:Uncharacterized protein n=1 Tax=Labeo rohita TaxID=84645 RepID=A0A498LHK7_LABRO|nr:hypothetical protein ROHU_012071 [Labeo rohita]
MYVDSAVHIQYSPATYEASRVEWDPGPLIVTGWSGERPRQGGSQACGEGGDVKRMRAHLLTYGLEVTVLHVGLISKAAALGINLECGLSGGWRAAQPFWVVGSTAWPAT